jgi:hypothetical protein
VRRVGLPKPHAPEERGADAHVTTQTEPEAPRRRPVLHRTDRCILAGDQSGVCCLRPRIILLDGFQLPCDAPDEQGCSGSSCRRANGRAAIPNRLSQPDWRVMPTDYLGGSPPLSPSLRRSRCRRFRLPHGCAASSAFHVGRRRHVWRLRSRAKVFLESSCGSLLAIIKRSNDRENGRTRGTGLAEAHHLAMRARRDSPGVGQALSLPRTPTRPATRDMARLAQASTVSEGSAMSHVARLLRASLDRANPR